MSFEEITVDGSCVVEGDLKNFILFSLQIINNKLV